MSNPDFEAYAKTHFEKTGRHWKGVPYQYFTLTDEKDGYPRTREALAGLDDSQLVEHWTRVAGGCLDAMFGHTTRKYRNLVTDEMLARGINEVPNIFGPIPVERYTF